MSYDLKITNGDLVLENGDLKKVQDSEKLIQDILKVCLTPVGANPMYPWYGSMISRSIIGSAIDPDILINIGKSQLISSLENLKTLQENQIKKRQRMTVDEQIASILSVEIKQNTSDFRLYSVLIRVISKGFKPVTTSFNISTI